jgi:hypothetical protein
MTTLITCAGPVDPDAPVTRTGGVPLVAVGFEWPRCAVCGGPMQFLAQVRLGDLARHGDSAAGQGVLSIYMCQNDPGLCDEWDPVSGGNRALLFPDDGLSAAPVPAEGVTALSEVCGVDYVLGADELRGAARGRARPPDGDELRRRLRLRVHLCDLRTGLVPLAVLRSRVPKRSRRGLGLAHTMGR